MGEQRSRPPLEVNAAVVINVAALGAIGWLIWSLGTTALERLFAVAFVAAAVVGWIGRQGLPDGGHRLSPGVQRGIVAAFAVLGVAVVATAGWATMGLVWLVPLLLLYPALRPRRR